MRKAKTVRKSVRALNRELATASRLAEDQSTRLGRLNIMVVQLRQVITDQVSIIGKRDLQIARLEGYIDRVREVEGQGDGIVVERMPADPSNAAPNVTAESILNMSEREFNSLIDRLPQDRLDRLMGKGGDED